MLCIENKTGDPHDTIIYFHDDIFKNNIVENLGIEDINININPTETNTINLRCFIKEISLENCDPSVNSDLFYQLQKGYNQKQHNEHFNSRIN